MTMAIEAGRDGATPANRVGLADWGTRREQSIAARSGRLEETPGVRYLYDEDGRILAEAFVGPDGD